MIPRSPLSSPAALEAPLPWVTELLLDHLCTNPKRHNMKYVAISFEGKKSGQDLLAVSKSVCIDNSSIIGVIVHTLPCILCACLEDLKS